MSDPLEDEGCLIDIEEIKQEEVIIEEFWPSPSKPAAPGDDFCEQLIIKDNGQEFLESSTEINDPLSVTEHAVSTDAEVSIASSSLQSTLSSSEVRSTNRLESSTCFITINNSQLTGSLTTVQQSNIIDLIEIETTTPDLTPVEKTLEISTNAAAKKGTKKTVAENSVEDLELEYEHTKLMNKFTTLWNNFKHKQLYWLENHDKCQLCIPAPKVLYFCPYCFKPFPSVENFAFHLGVNQLSSQQFTNQYRISICGYIYCAECSDEFTNIKSYENHLNKQHKRPTSVLNSTVKPVNKDEVWFPCSTCSFYFSSICRLGTHQRCMKHVKDHFVCSNCDTEFCDKFSFGCHQDICDCSQEVEEDIMETASINSTRPASPEFISTKTTSNKRPLETPGTNQRQVKKSTVSQQDPISALVPQVLPKQTFKVLPCWTETKTLYPMRLVGHLAKGFSLFIKNNCFFIAPGSRPKRPILSVYICPFCFIMYTNLRSYYKHIGVRTQEDNIAELYKVHLSQHRLKCIMCGDMFSSLVSYNSHVVTHSDKGHAECAKCGCQFNVVCALNRHQSASPISCSKPHPCSKCCATFPNFLSLQIHLNKCSTRFCSKCGLGFCSWQEYLKHQNKDTQKRLHGKYPKFTSDLIFPTIKSILFPVASAQEDEGDDIQDVPVNDARSCEIPVYYCPYCEEQFHHLNVLAKHLASCDTHEEVEDSDQSEDGLDAEPESVHERDPTPEPIPELDLTNVDLEDGPMEILEDSQPKPNSIKNSKLKCSLCSTRFPDIDSFEVHFIINHCKPAIYPCLICSELFETIAALNNHQKWHHYLKIRPEHATLKFISSKAEFSRGKIYTIDESSPSFNVLCRKCGVSFTEKSTFANHFLKYHQVIMDFVTPGHKCLLCLELFSDKEVLVHHIMVTHHGSIKAQEGVTDYSWTLGEGDTITNENSASTWLLQCQICQRRFLLTSDFKCHLETAHPSMLGVDREDVICHYCDIPLSSVQELNEHFLQSHQACKLCNTFFSNKKRAFEHVKAHNLGQIKSLYCPCCSEAFIEQKDLDRHFLDAHGIPFPKLAPKWMKGKTFTKSSVMVSEKENFWCIYCDTELFARSVLVNHLEKRHRILECLYCRKLCSLLSGVWGSKYNGACVSCQSKMVLDGNTTVEIGT